jgi:hypothetical protein
MLSGRFAPYKLPLEIYVEECATNISQFGICVTLLALSMGMQAQSEGENAIYTGSTTAPGVFTDYIDAYPFYMNSKDLCVAINDIITSGYRANCAVIDARGIIPNYSGLP